MVNNCVLIVVMRRSDEEDEMPPLRLLSPYPESETPAKSPDTLQNDLNCGRTTVGRPPEESLAQMG
jgi:hypothetical protein